MKSKTKVNKGKKKTPPTDRFKDVHRSVSVHKKRFYEGKKKIYDHRDRRRFSFGTIQSDRSSRSLSLQEKGISQFSESNLNFEKKTKKRQETDSFDYKATGKQPGIIRRIQLCFCIIAALVVVGILAYIAIQWVLETFSKNVSNSNIKDNNSNEKESFFAIDEISNFPSTSSYPTTEIPSSRPTLTLTSQPSGHPSKIPSHLPSSTPSSKPTTIPSLHPSRSFLPSKRLPSFDPSSSPSQSQSPTYMGWRQIGSELVTSDVVHSADISGNGSRIILGMPLNTSGGKIDLFELIDNDWQHVYEFTGNNVDWMYRTVGPLDSCGYLGIDVKLNRNGDRIGSISKTPSEYNNYTRVSYLTESAPGVWGAAHLHSDVYSFDLGSDSMYIDISDWNRGYLSRYKRCGLPHDFIYCVSLGGFDDSLDFSDPGIVITSLSVSDSGNRIVIGRASYNKNVGSMQILQAGRVDVYDLVLLDKFYLEPVKIDGDRSEEAFFGVSLLERKGDVVKISGDGSTVLIGGWIKRVYNDIFTSFNFTLPPYLPLIGKPYIDVWHFSDSVGWTKRGDRFTAPSTASAWGLATAINVHGNIIAIGDQVFNNVGMVQVYEFDGDDWIEMGKTFYGTTFERWGKSLAFSGDKIPKLIISSTNGENSTVRVFEYEGIS